MANFKVVRPFGKGISEVGLRTIGKSLNEVLQEESQDSLVGYLYDEAPPYVAPVIQEEIEQTPDPQPTVKEKLWQYRGGAAIVAAPGDVLPKVYGTTIVQGRVIWASDPYLDEHNRSRIDVAYGMCHGEIDGILRIYGGNDKQLLWNSETLNGNANGIKYWKKKKVYNGGSDQLQSNIIVDHEGTDDTPNYKGLAYIVFRGLKLYKFNKTAPDLWFVVSREIDSLEVPDVYPPTGPIWYEGGMGLTVTSITGVPDTDFVYVTTSGEHVYQVELSTDTWTSLGTAGNTSCSSNILGMINNDLYYLHFNDLRKWVSGTTWITAHNTAFASIRLEQTPDRTKLAYFDGSTGSTELWTFDGATPVDENWTGIADGYGNPKAMTITNGGDIYVLGYKNTSDALFYRKLSGGSWQKTVVKTDNYNNTQSMIYISDDGLMHITNYNNSDQDMYHYWEDFVVDPGSPSTSGSNKILTDTTSRSNDLERFSDRYHFVRNLGGSPNVYREETNLSITTLPLPTGATFTRSFVLQKIGTALYCGTNDGFYRVSDVTP